MVMVMARSLITSVAEREAAPDVVLRTVNRLLSPDLRRGLYVTVLLARLEPQTGALTIVNAGHTPLMVCRARSQEVELVHSDGIALGFDRGPVFERTLKAREVTLEPGDRAVFCTSRDFALKNRKGQELTDRAFQTLLQSEFTKGTSALVNRLAAILEKFREGAPAESEITLLSLSRNA
jgi:serine phosphatase RsbU (regulator of sigma subunit)